MKIFVDTEYKLQESYCNSERRTALRIGEALRECGHTVSFGDYHSLETLYEYDVYIWSNPGCVMGFIPCLPGHVTACQICISHGGCPPNLALDGIIYTSSTYTAYQNYLYIMPPFNRVFPLVAAEDYILISGMLIPHRGLHIALLANLLTRSRFPMKIVFNGGFTHWPDCDPLGEYYNLCQYYLGKARQRFEIVEYESLPQAAFLDILRKAKIYLMCGPSNNSTVMEEALVYGIPIVGRKGCSDFGYFDSIPDICHDWWFAEIMAKRIDEILDDYTPVRNRYIAQASQLYSICNYETIGKKLTEFLLRIFQQKQDKDPLYNKDDQSPHERITTFKGE